MSDKKEFKEFENLPEGWKIVTINSIIKNGLISGIWGEEPKDFENIYPILRSTEISHTGRIVIKNVAFRKVKLETSKISKYVLRNGDILIVSSSGSEELIGRVAIFKYPGNEKFLFSNFLLRLRVGEKTDSTYMFYLLSSFWYRDFLSKFQETSTGLRNFPKNEFLNYFFLPLPPLPEQKKIAEILETVDNAIEKTDKIIEKYKRIKQGLMQDLLTKGIDENGNIRDEKTHKFKDSPLGRIPEEWEVVRLGEVGEIISGSTPNTNNADYWNGEIVWITPEDLSKTKTIYIENSSRKITQQALKSCSIKIIPENSVVISSRAPIGYVKVSKVKFTTNQGCKSIAYNGSFSPEFLAFLLSNKIQDMINMGSGTTFQEITKSNLAKILIPLPPLSEQQRIAEILSQIDKTIEKEEQYKEKLKRIKQGLMEDLLTGKVRVKNIIEED